MFVIFRSITAKTQFIFEELISIGYILEVQNRKRHLPSILCFRQSSCNEHDVKINEARAAGRTARNQAFGFLRINNNEDILPFPGSLCR